LVKVSVNRYVLNRTAKTRNIIKTTIQKLRIKTIENLEEIFQTASKIVTGKIKHQRIHGKLKRITHSQRQAWLHIAEHTAKTINTISTNFNEKEITEALNQLEDLIKNLEG
jgi:truncated hemoglobin YjbI